MAFNGETLIWFLEISSPANRCFCKILECIIGSFCVEKCVLEFV